MSSRNQHDGPEDPYWSPRTVATNDATRRPMPAQSLPQPWRRSQYNERVPSQIPSEQTWPSQATESSLSRATIPSPQELSSRSSLAARSTRPLSVSSLLTPSIPDSIESRSRLSTNHSRGETQQASAYMVPPGSGRQMQVPERTYLLPMLGTHRECLSVVTGSQNDSQLASQFRPPPYYAHGGKDDSCVEAKAVVPGKDETTRITSAQNESGVQFLRATLLDYTLTVRQQPVAARACGYGDRDRRAIDPPPIVELRIKSNTSVEPEEDADGRFVLHCTLVNEDGVEDESQLHSDSVLIARRLIGTLIASPNNVQDERGIPGRFFLFHDLSCRTLGQYRLHFRLVRFDRSKLQPGTMFPIVASIVTQPFTVYSAQDFPGMRASSDLVKALRAQGVAASIKKGCEFSRAGRWKKKALEKSSNVDLANDTKDEAEGDASESGEHTV